MFTLCCLLCPLGLYMGIVAGWCNRCSANIIGWGMTLLTLAYSATVQVYSVLPPPVVCKGVLYKCPHDLLLLVDVPYSMSASGGDWEWSPNGGVLWEDMHLLIAQNVQDSAGYDD